MLSLFKKFPFKFIIGLTFYRDSDSIKVQYPYEEKFLQDDKSKILLLSYVMCFPIFTNMYSLF